MSTLGNKNRLIGLDGLRAVAVILVFISHSTSFGRYYDLGAGGVWLFFVLSGFLIIGILNATRNQQTLNTKAYFAYIFEFYTRRAFRIFPPYYAIILLVSIVFSTVGIIGLSWRSLGYIAIYATNIILPLDDAAWHAHFSHFWSVAIEEQFYLVSAPIFLFLNTIWSRFACIIIIIISIANSIRLTSIHASHIAIYVDSLINCGMLAAGGIAALTPLRTGLPGKRSWLAAASMIAYLTVPYLSHVFPQLDPLRPQIFCIISCLLIVEVAGNQQSAIVRMLDLTPLRNLGIISYTFYLIHPFCIIQNDNGASFLDGLTIPFHIVAPIAQLLEFSLCVLLSTLSWRYFEKPILGLRDRLVSRQGLERPVGSPIRGAADGEARKSSHLPPAAPSGARSRA